MKTSQHLLSSVCIALKVSPYAQATTLQSSFEGPGRLECFRGECDFNVDHGFGCSDPCHTHTRSNMYEYTFEDVSVMSDDLFLPTETTRNTDMSDLPCYYMHASLINTTDWFDPWPLKIDEGCHAVCTGCTFYQTLTFSGPGSLACTDGSCYNYTYGNKYNDCGVDLEDVSGDWGELSTVFSGDNSSYVFQGFEHINTVENEPIRLRKGCSLDCYDCSFVEDIAIPIKGPWRPLRGKKYFRFHQ